MIDGSYRSVLSCLVSVQPVRELTVNLSVLLVKKAILVTDVNCKYVFYGWYTVMWIKPSNQYPLSRFHDRNISLFLYNRSPPTNLMKLIHLSYLHCSTIKYAYISYFL